MPLYDYSCYDCGAFRDWQPISASTKPAACPSCGEKASRGIAAPFIANMNPHNRIAHQRNEKSADEPRVVRKKTHDHDADSHPHRHGSHGHSHSHGHGRPWMIGH